MSNPYLTTEALAAIEQRDALSNGVRNHFGICGIRLEDHEQCEVCAADSAGPDDRTALLAYVKPLRDELSKAQKERTDWEVEAGRLRELASRVSREVESLGCLADAVEVLRDIGKVFGCGHVDDPDGRRQLVNCIDQEFQRVNDAHEACKLLLREARSLIIERGESTEVPLQFRQHGWLTQVNAILPVEVPN